MPMSKLKKKEYNGRYYQEHKSVFQKVRFQVFRRDNFTCQYCGRMASDGITLEVDHILAKANGGQNELSNLITTCKECNRGKGDVLLNKPAKIPIQIPKIPGLMIQGNKIVGIDKMTHKLDEPKLPICDEYNFRQFRPGDKVLIRRGRRLIETVIPELDVDGNPM